MRKCMDEVDLLIKSGISCIWIDTYEEAEVLRDIKALVKREYKTFPLRVWSNTEGMKKIPTIAGETAQPPDRKFREPNAVFEYIATAAGFREESQGSRNIFVLRDLNELMGRDPRVKRYIRDIMEYPMRYQNIIIVVSPQVDIPDDIAKLFRVVDYDLPDRAYAMELIAHVVTQALTKNKLKEEPSPKEYGDAVDASMGLTAREIISAATESIVRSGKLDTSFLMEHKIQEVRKSGVLDFKIPAISLEDVGGNRAIKEWLYEQKSLFNEDARTFGLEMPKGYMSVGVPGSAKTMLAEAFAGMMGIPMLSLSMSKIMSKLVGESERKIEYALSVAKSCAPCVLLLDEVEKLVGGAGAGGSSNRTDGGVTNRVFAALLKFMNDNESGVYVIMTSNDVSSLPPEFTREGRVDAQWYFGLPKAEERKEIFEIHFKKFGRTLESALLDYAVEHTDGYTGAEIKGVVKNCMRKAYIRHTNGEEADITEEDIQAAINEVIPVSRSSREKIMALENWCADRARRSDYDEHEEQDDKDDRPYCNSIFDI